jgi:hypothetical protein
MAAGPVHPRVHERLGARALRRGRSDAGAPTRELRRPSLTLQPSILRIFFADDRSGPLARRQTLETTPDAHLSNPRNIQAVRPSK